MPRKPNLAHLNAPVEEYLSERAATEREIDKELACLVAEKGWVYAQRVAKQIENEFDCKPTEPGWIVLTNIQFAFNQLFGRISKRAKQADLGARTPGQSILAEIQEGNGDSSRGRSTDDTSARSGSNGGRARAGAKHSRRRRGAE